VPGRLCTCSGRLGVMKEMGAHRGGVCCCMHGEGAQEQRVKCLQECEVWFVCHLRDCNAERVY
jgi:hypothetical protein